MCLKWNTKSNAVSLLQTTEIIAPIPRAVYSVLCAFRRVCRQATALAGVWFVRPIIANFPFFFSVSFFVHWLLHSRCHREPRAGSAVAGSGAAAPWLSLRWSSVLPPERRSLVSQRLVNARGLFCARMLCLLQKPTIDGARVDVAVRLHLCAQACRRIHLLGAACVKIPCRRSYTRTQINRFHPAQLLIPSWICARTV